MPVRDVPSFETTECLRLNMDVYEYDLLSEFGKDVVTTRNNLACCSQRNVAAVCRASRA